MLRTLSMIALLAVAAQAQEGAALAVGSDAPPLTIAKWVKGDAVALEKNKAYVVEFWATWCVPCLMSMLHLSELQETYKDKITFVGVTTQDEQGNTLEAVETMVKGKGPGMGYTVAWDDAGKTYGAWMTAAGQGGIPTSFVVDGNGKIAYIGHPMTLDLVLARMAAGTWDPAKGPAEVGAICARADEILKMDRKMALDALSGLEKEHPQVAAYVASRKFRLLLLAGKSEEASALGTRLVEKSAKFNDPIGLNEVGWFIVDPKTALAKRDLDLALNAAAKAVELTKGEDGGILDTLARVYYWKGDLAKAIDLQTKAVEKAAGDEELLPDLESALKEYQAAAAAKKE